LAFKVELHQMLGIIHCCNKHCSHHFQGECIVVGCFWKPYIGQAVGDKLDMMVLIGEAEEWAACLVTTRYPEDYDCSIAKMLDNSQHSVQLSSES
jgi:hypothetical protein